METERILVNTRKLNLNEVLENAEEMIDEFDLGRKDFIHLRLLLEETLGMLKAMAGDYDAVIWMEKNDDQCTVHLTAKTDSMNYSTKQELLSISKSGNNSLVKGFMGKIGDFIENGLLNYDEVMKLQQEYGTSNVQEFTYMGMNSSEMMMTWTLEQYRVSLDDSDKNGQWDELERSIVASLAKDVIVGVKKDHVEMMIILEVKGN